MARLPHTHRKTTQIRPRVGAIVLTLAFATPGYGAECLNYNKIQVRGMLSSQTFPGPPNYETASSGDLEETYFFITLVRPMCVAKGKSELEPTVERIESIQLIFDWQTAQSSYKSLRPYLGKTVECSGVLLGQHTAHHHSEVMLTQATCHGA